MQASAIQTGLRNDFLRRIESLKVQWLPISAQFIKFIGAILFNCDLFFDILTADLDAINSYFTKLDIDKLFRFGSFLELSARARYYRKFNECVAEHTTFVFDQQVRKCTI